MTKQNIKQFPSIDEVRTFWNTNPVHSVEFPNRNDQKAYFDFVDTLRWTDNEKWAEKVFYDLSGNEDTKILDAGCGIGVFTRYYARKGFQVDAIDITERALEETKRSLELNNLKATLHQGSVEELPFKDDTFDYIVSNGVVHHTPNTEKAVAEFLRVLKPGGVATVCVYYKNILLKEPLWQITKRILPKILKKSAGRENMLYISTPEELARTYDGNNTPIARIYSKADADELFKSFIILKREPHFFPSRFLRFIPRGGIMHMLLDRYFGFLIYYLIKKP